MGSYRFQQQDTCERYPTATRDGVDVNSSGIGWRNITWAWEHLSASCTSIHTIFEHPCGTPSQVREASKEVLAAIIVSSLRTAEHVVLGLRGGTKKVATSMLLVPG